MRKAIDLGLDFVLDQSFEMFKLGGVEDVAIQAGKEGFNAGGESSFHDPEDILGF